MNTAPAQSIAARLSRWCSRFSSSPKPPEAPHLALGARGEALAGKFLRQNGYKILYRNFRGRRGGEIDIVCRDGDTLAFIEVKTRSSEEWGRPFDAVDRAKQNRISRGALAWLRLLDNPDIFFRFDVMEVIIAEGAEPRLELIKNAFQLSKPYLY